MQSNNKRNYWVILNHENAYYFKTLDGVIRFIRLLEEETDVFDEKVDIQINTELGKLK